MSAKEINHSERAHALLGASGAGRWLTCTPSARLEEQFPEQESSVYAEEGTFAHELSELEIRYALDFLKLDDFVAKKNELMKSDWFSSEMVEETDKFIHHVIDSWREAKKADKFAQILIEDRMDLSDYIPEGFGTNDVVILSGGTLYVKDLKFGKGLRVKADDNPQLMLYALGAWEKHGFNFPIERVNLEINQPRLGNVSTFEMPVDDLLAWGDEYVKPRAKTAFKGGGDFVAGDHCRYCRASTKCKALADFNLAIAKEAFAEPALLTDRQLLDVFDKAPAFTKWVNQITDFVKKEALAGRKWEGYKLIEGRSNRVITNEPQARAALSKAGILTRNFTNEKLKGIGDLEKLLGKKDFAAVLGPFVVKPAGSPTLVSADDPRPELNSVEAVKDSFKDESKEI